ncbi:MAG: metallophosphoesterase family protein [Planctomycetota bacterium]
MARRSRWRRRLGFLLIGVLLALVVCFRITTPPRVLGPLVQQLREDSALVLLHTPGGARQLRLEYRYAGAGSPAGSAWHRVLDPRPVKRHLFRLTPLDADRDWDYRILDRDRQVLAEGRFHSAPEAGTGSARFVAFGDSGALPWWRFLSDAAPFEPRAWLRDLLPGRGRQWQLAARVVPEEPALIVHLGDLVYPWGRREHYPEAFFLPLAELLRSVAFYPTAGNHDLITEGGAPYLEMFEMPGKQGPGRGFYYDFVYGPVRFYCVDSFKNSIEPGSPQHQWLVQRLGAAKERWRVLFTHRPFLSVSRSEKHQASRRLKESLHPLLAKHRVQLVLSGHDHVYQRFKSLDGVTYVVAGGGGKSLYDLRPRPDLARSARRYGFVVVDADERRMQMRTIAIDGTELDRFEF